ncbi:MAG: cyclic nucleotide-binding domain-containing protein [Deltaproteobacteria bacterium]|nr:cyclic nucleotide-binding domain-containing protein [Deltaproteobacteria bacterium]
MTLTPHVVTRTDIGRVRTNNEDAFLADHDLGLFAVCDGMGGHQAGEVAARTTCDTVHRELAAAAKLRGRFLASGSPTDAIALRRAVEAAILSACKEVYRQASRTPELAGMGTTCTVVLLIGHNKGILGHVGDSRLFVLRGGRVHQLSEDHTYVNELVKRGALTREQARNHPQGNVLSRALGVQPTVAVDTMIFDIDPGDTYLLCSDGLYNYYPDSDELAQGLSDTVLANGVNLLIDRALTRGGHDNCTAIALRFAGAPVLTPTAAEQRIAMLKRIPFFAHLTYPELVKVVGLTELGRAGAGQEVIQEGEQGDELYVILSGEVTIIKDAQTIATLKAGAHVGEMGLIDNAPRSATVRAKTDVNLLVMRREEFFSLIRGEPLIAAKLLWSFLQVLSGRLRDTNEQLRGARSKLASSEGLEVFIDEE